MLGKRYKRLSTLLEMKKDKIDVTNRNVECLTSARALVNRAWGAPASNRASYSELLREAQALLEAELQVTPDDVAVLTCLGAVLCDLQLHSQALEYLARAIALGAIDWHTYFNAFVALLRCSTIDDARAMLTRGADFDADPATWQAYFDPHAM